MCMRVVERYAVCKCVYYTHGIDQCSAYGRRGHAVQDKTVLVGHTCPNHSNANWATGPSPNFGGFPGSDNTGGLGEFGRYHAHRR